MITIAFKIIIEKFAVSIILERSIRLRSNHLGKINWTGQSFMPNWRSMMTYFRREVIEVTMTRSVLFWYLQVYFRKSTG